MTDRPEPQTRASVRSADVRARVAYFAEIFPSESETWIHHEIRELIRSGCDVKIFATRARPTRLAGENRDLEGCTVYLPEVQAGHALRRVRAIARLARGILPSILLDCNGARQRAQAVRSVLHLATLLDEIDAFEPDVIHVHFAGSRANLALLYNMLRGTPFFVKMHAGDVWARPGLFRMKVARSAGIFITSRAAADYVRHHNPDVDHSRISEQMVGVPIETFRCRSALDDNPAPTFLAVARLVPMKGLHVLIEAAAVLRRRGYEHRIVIIGGGPEKERLLALRARLGVDDCVELRGYGTPEEVRAALRGATAFVLPCIWDDVEKTQDGMPIALMEAMASCVPVVSTTISGIPELIEDQVSGRLVPPGDSVALADALARTASDDAATRDRMVRNARAVIAGRFDTAKVTADLLAAFEAACASHRTSSGK